MSFEKLSSILKDVFDIMEDCGMAYIEDHKITTTFDEMHTCPYFDVQTKISILRMATDHTGQTFKSITSTPPLSLLIMT